MVRLQTQKTNFFFIFSRNLYCFFGINRYSDLGALCNFNRRAKRFMYICIYVYVMYKYVYAYEYVYVQTFKIYMYVISKTVCMILHTSILNKFDVEQQIIIKIAILNHIRPFLNWLQCITC